MPIRSASFTKRLADNGKALHRAMAGRTSGDNTPSAEESALAEERRLLKEQRDERREKTLQPGPTALDKLVRTHHAQRKEKPNATSEARAAAKDVKKPKAHRTRAEKHAEQAAAIEAARNRPKKAAK